MDRLKERFRSIKNVVVVLSGKGGVGKSSVSSVLAARLVKSGYRVGVLDLDITGPNIPRIIGAPEKKILQSEKGWIPVYVDEEKKLGVISIGYLIKKKDAVIWRGPRKHGIIQQFLVDVNWGELDYLIIDTPPGTSDEHISLVELLHKAIPTSTLNANISKLRIIAEEETLEEKTKLGAVIVTTPQEVALIDIKKEINFCKKVNLEIIGLVENMSGFLCPNCDEIHQIFSSGGGMNLAKNSFINMLCKIPLDPRLVEICDKEGVKILLDDENEKNNLRKPVLNAFQQLIEFVENWSNDRKTNNDSDEDGDEEDEEDENEKKEQMSKIQKKRKKMESFDF
ncbi:nucleotide-binding protein nbp35 -related [Anaeramoeba flamelloides]|uniref:Nucleotide-binding protein nbp35 -related n=1 Tax=Anaeramoeba flamelloides TaxID=1746091 RepID=A0AAV8A591_9EUKA|nr:nucleotide-binding protein nbp35 -related [Anaeramoeba flamelloides]